MCNLRSSASFPNDVCLKISSICARSGTVASGAAVGGGVVRGWLDCRLESVATCPSKTTAPTQNTPNHIANKSFALTCNLSGVVAAATDLLVAPIHRDLAPSHKNTLA